MKLAIMQPYFFPYIGYFQLINAVDEFVIYDNIEFTKKGWINRNRILVNGKDAIISLPLKKDSDYLHVSERFLSDTWDVERKKMLNRIKEAYRKAPFFKEAFQLIEKCLMHNDTNLFIIIYNSLQLIINYLGINTKCIISSSLDIDHQLKSEKKVIAICKEIKATTYINPIGGLELYSKESFKKEKINLHFISTSIVEYNQFDNQFVPMLSIIDILMFNSKDEIKNLLNQYSLQ